MKNKHLYIHIPFCVKKCNYCDFLSAPASRPVQEAYLRTLEEEIRSESKHYADYRVDTVFVGGGTPTAVDPEALCKILSAVKESFFLAEDAEVTVEANPGTVNRDTLFMLRRAGVNRLSIGLQSTDREELSLLGRIHTYEDFLVTYRLALEAGFRNLNVDLMMALPGQRVCDYEKTLRRVLSLQPLPTHISAYSLIIEEGTPFFERYGEQSREMERTGRLPCPRRRRAACARMRPRKDRTACLMRRKSGRWMHSPKSCFFRQDTEGMRFPIIVWRDLPANITPCTGGGETMWDLGWEPHPWWRMSDSATQTNFRSI